MPDFVDRGQSFAIKRMFHNNQDQFPVAADDLAQVQRSRGMDFYQFAGLERVYAELDGKLK